MKVLITGCNGFVGRHLSTYLRSLGRDIVGIDVQAEGWTAWVDYHCLDVTNSDQVNKLPSMASFDEIYHLAAVANPKIASEQPLKTIEINVGGTANLCELIKNHRYIKMLVVGTSKEYKLRTGSNIVFFEDDRLAAGSIYSTSKICAEFIGLEYCRQYGLNIYFTRSFNHSGPGQDSSYVLSDFAKQCAEIKLGRKKTVLRVGNIDVSRDFLDVRDVVSAYVDIVEKGESGEVYNVCSGRSYPLRDLLEILISHTGRKDVRIQGDVEKIRENDPIDIRGDNTKLKSHTGWIDRVHVNTMLRDLFVSWEEWLLIRSKLPSETAEL